MDNRSAEQRFHTCPDCKNQFVQPFVCTTCGAQRLYDVTVTSQAATIERLQKQDRLAIYGRMVLEESRESLGDLDGGWLQDKAIECGLLEEATVSAPCGENCRCAEYGDFPQRCLRLTDAGNAVTVTETEKST